MRLPIRSFLKSMGAYQFHIAILGMSSGAVKLYELGRLSSVSAAELAGMSRIEFLNILGKYKVFPMEAELRELESRHV